SPSIVSRRVPPHLRTTPYYPSPPTTDIYTLSLHDALPIFSRLRSSLPMNSSPVVRVMLPTPSLVPVLPSDADLKHKEGVGSMTRSEEHTSELQSRENLVCRLLLEKKKKIKVQTASHSRSHL